MLQRGHAGAMRIHDLLESSDQAWGLGRISPEGGSTLCTENRQTSTGWNILGTASIAVIPVSLLLDLCTPSPWSSALLWVNPQGDTIKTHSPSSTSFRSPGVRKIHQSAPRISTQLEKQCLFFFFLAFYVFNVFMKVKHAQGMKKEIQTAYNKQ